jgi:phosphoribosylamine--glycine ligase
MPIHGLDAVHGDTVKVFHAGTTRVGQEIVASGGRVLCVTALGENISAAQRACYEAADKISWNGMILRRDIGWRAIARYS